MFMGSQIASNIIEEKNWSNSNFHNISQNQENLMKNMLQLQFKDYINSAALIISIK